mgnify:CR=1 FL=1|jgi:hypothetical protein|tara:strand:- start:314 stop:547 length:234 start_codon:yes stop_codon:yes gene_type:complete
MPKTYELVVEDDNEKQVKITNEEGEERIVRISDLKREYKKVKSRLASLQEREQEIKDEVTAIKTALTLDVTIPDGDK